MTDDGNKDALGPLGGGVRTSWQQFLDLFEPTRPELYRYCRHLTRTPWDAEDLVQDALSRAFVTLGTMFRPVENPRAWIFRIASNLWIDRTRRARFESSAEATAEGEGNTDPRASREAAGTLYARLSPQERAALVLKDVFDFSVDEIAGLLSTSSGAIKAALHRGRGQLQDNESPATRAPAPGVLDAFCEAFNARDLERLTSLLLENATVEIVGLVTEYGQDAPKDPYTGSFAGSLAPLTFDERGGVAQEFLAGYRGGLARCEVRAYRGSQLLVFWYDHDEGPLVRSVFTVETEGDAVLRVRNYFFSPDVLAEVCAELGLPHRVNGYRYWPA